jgi:hypothetical protein
MAVGLILQWWVQDFQHTHGLLGWSLK